MVLWWVEDMMLRRLHRVGRNHVRVGLTHIHRVLSARRRIHRLHCALLLPHSYLIEGDFAKDLKLFLCVCGDWGHCLASLQLLLAHNSLADVAAKPVTPVADISEAEVQVVTGEADPVSHSLHQTLSLLVVTDTILLAILKLLLAVVVLDHLLRSTRSCF